MSFSSSLSSVAYTLLSTYGQAVTLSRTAEGAYDPSTSGVSDGATTTFSGYGHPSNYNTNEIDGTTVLTTDIKLLLYSTTAPLVGDVTTIGSVALRVMNVKTTNAQGTPVVYVVQLR